MPILDEETLEIAVRAAMNTYQEINPLEPLIEDYELEYDDIEIIVAAALKSIGFDDTEMEAERERKLQERIVLHDKKMEELRANTPAEDWFNAKISLILKD